MVFILRIAKLQTQSVCESTHRNRFSYIQPTHITSIVKYKIN